MSYAQKIFYTAANMVLDMYALRQRYPESSSYSQTAEMDCACNELYGIASAAAYSGCKAATIIRAAAECWKKTGDKPGYFSVNELDSPAHLLQIGRLNIYPTSGE